MSETFQIYSVGQVEKSEKETHLIIDPKFTDALLGTVNVPQWV